MRKSQRVLIGGARQLKACCLGSCLAITFVELVGTQGTHEQLVDPVGRRPMSPSKPKEPL